MGGLWPILGIVWLSAWVTPVEAELVYFAKGTEAQVPITSDGPKIRIELPGASFDFAREDIRKIVPGFWPEREWPARESKARAGGVEERAAAAWWALENGLTPEAASMLKSAHQLDPSHQPTARMVAILERLSRPGDDPDLEPLFRILGGSAEVSRGPHVVLLHQQTADEALERVDLLERVITTYYLMFAAQGIELPIPRSRFASVFFAEHKDYLEYLRGANLEVFRSTRGYFHPTLNAVLAYDSRSAGALKALSETLAARRSELAALRQTLDRLPPQGRLLVELRGESPRAMSRSQARKALDSWQGDVNRRALVLELDRRSVDLGTAAHEMVHQLVAASRLAPHHDDFPIWLHEGLAAQFEVIRGGRWAGVGRAHELRLPDWRSRTRRTPLPLLIEDQGFGRGYQKDAYAQAWALVYFLRKEHPREFLTFLDLLRTPGGALPRSKDRASTAFQRAFGENLDGLEQDWHRYLDRVQTPLEEHRDSATAATTDDRIPVPN